MTIQKIQRAPRAQSKEAYRLWFEFLRRAIAEDKSKVKIDLYREWGNIETYKFDKWWEEIGKKVISLTPSLVEQIDEGKADDVTYLLRVPKSQTSTQIGEQVRKFLMEIGHQPIELSQLRVRLGAEIRPSTYRAYLHTFDQNKKLLEITNGQKPTSRELLKSVRKFYLEREKRYKNNLWKVDKLPSPLAMDLNRSDLDKINVLDSATAINAVSRYLRKANEIIDAVRQGRFPE